MGETQEDFNNSRCSYCHLPRKDWVTALCDESESGYHGGEDTFRLMMEAEAEMEVIVPRKSEVLSDE